MSKCFPVSLYKNNQREWNSFGKIQNKSRLHYMNLIDFDDNELWDLFRNVFRYIRFLKNPFDLVFLYSCGFDFWEIVLLNAYLKINEGYSCHWEGEQN